VNSSWPPTPPPRTPPAGITFCPNGRVIVLDNHGNQLPEYCLYRTHAEAIRLLAADGYDWLDLQYRGIPNHILPQIFPEIKIPARDLVLQPAN